MRIPLLLPALAVLSLVAGCVGPPRAAVAPPPVRVVTPPPPAAPAILPTDWRDWPQTPGDWEYRRYNGHSSATFGREAPGLLTLSCASDDRVRLTHVGPGHGALTIRTSSITRSIATRASEDPSGASDAWLAADDPLLDAIGFSRGRFVVEQAGAPPLVLPAWAEVERVVEDCRS